MPAFTAFAQKLCNETVQRYCAILGARRPLDERARPPEQTSVGAASTVWFERYSALASAMRMAALAGVMLLPVCAFTELVKALSLPAFALAFGAVATELACA